jgi:GH18 family chitinase
MRVERAARRRGAALALLLGLAGLLPGCSHPPGDQAAAAAAGQPMGFTIVGYLPDYRIAAANPRLLGRYYTDIVLFSVMPTAAGGLDTSRLSASRLAVVPRLKAAGVQRVLVTAGGGFRCNGFAAAAHDPAARLKLVTGLREFCLRSGLDGVDFDWEFPASAQEQADYETLLVETKDAFQPRGLLVTAAVTGNQTLSRQALAALDRVHIMAYDAAGEHSTYDLAIQETQAWLGKGAQPAQLCLGVPFYGRETDRRRRSLPYSAIAAQVHPEPAADHAGAFYFNGTQTLQRKAQYARALGLAGVMVWEVGQDTPDCTLARALKAAAGQGTGQEDT